jgi:hypothetical protein
MSEDGHTDSAIGAVQPDLTPHQRQYLAKMLGQLAMSRGPFTFIRSMAAVFTLALFCFTEWAYLSEVGGLTAYGLPFNVENAIPDKKLKRRSWLDPPQSPVLRYMFRHFILQFPGLKDAPHKYWTKTVQPLFDDIASRYGRGSA